MKKFILTLPFFLCFGLVSQEKENPIEPNTSPSIENFKKELQEYYSPPDCFFLSFKTDIVVPNMGRQSAEGSVRADNKNNRIRILLVEPNLGITISWITIIRNMAYLSNPRREGVIKISLKELELGSFANNNIKIPFSLFKDILFGRLPEELLESETWEIDDQIKGTYRNHQGDLVTFFFNKKEPKRIEKIEYRNPKTNYIGIVNFINKFYNTKYPQKIEIQTFQNKTSLESMWISFYRYIENARCKNEHFPLQ
ncbi:MAG: hypothetical protein ACK4UJ_00675 [Leptonema sp. (in: bacteria)]